MERKVQRWQLQDACMENIPNHLSWSATSECSLVTTVFTATAELAFERDPRCSLFSFPYCRASVLPKAGSQSHIHLSQEGKVVPRIE